MDKEKIYSAFLFRQRVDAPCQVAFVASSSEIDSWARVPTKTTGNIRNFQRAEIDQHVSEVEEFFRSPVNASPTAVVVGFDPFRSHGRVELLREDGTVVDPDEVPAGNPIAGKVRIRWLEDTDPQSESEYIEAIASRRAILQRFAFEELHELLGLSESTLDDLLVVLEGRLVEGLPALSGNASDGPDALGEDGDEEDGNGESDEGGDYEGSDDKSSEVVARALTGLSPSERQLALARLEFLANLRKDLLAKNPKGALRQIYDGVHAETKPGLLIDGQHRVIGSKNVGEIPFLVCALPRAQWPELAFQFIVTNRTAKRVQESLLINIVGNSLSKKQRASIEERLRNAGIRVGLIEAVMKVHEDETSPFFDMLAFGLKDESGFLDAAAVRNKVVKLWYERKSPVQELFDHFCEGKLKRDRTDYWKSEDLWFDYFTEFWSAVRERYDGDGVFSKELVDVSKKKPASKLMTATVLKIFQETVLEDILRYLKNKEDKEGSAISASLPNSSKFADLVRNSLKALTPAFFEGWTITGFDGSKGARIDLVDAMQAVLQGGMSVAKVKGKPFRLFKDT